MESISGRAVAAAGVVICSLVGCTTVTVRSPGGEPVTRTHAEFRAYGEQVFRLQNAVLDELISTAEDDTGLPVQDDPALLAAEDEIVESCRDLNEAAGLSAEGLKPGLPLQLRVMDSMPRCEASAVAVKALLDGRSGFASAVMP